MPTSVSINGGRTRRPGVYGKVDTSALGGSGTSLAGVALVGDLPLFQQSTRYVYSSARQLTDHDPASALLALLARIAFSPANDTRVPGGASPLTVVSTATTTQATAQLLDADDSPAITLKSRVWGVAGNRVSFSASRASDTYTVLLSRDGLNERVTAECPALGTIQYTGATLSAAVLTWNASTVTYGWSRVLGPKSAGPGAPLEVDTNWTHAPLAGTIAVLLAEGAGAAHAGNVVLDFVGTTSAGVAQTETLTIASGGNVGTTTKTWGTLTSVTVDSADNAWVGTATLTAANGRVISLVGRTISSVLVELGQITGVTASVAVPRASSLAGSAADYTDGTIDVRTAPVSIRADNSLVVEALGASRLVEAARGAGLRVDLASPVAGVLSAGTEASPVGTAAWTAALDAIVDADIQIVVLFTPDATVHALAAEHCNAAALQGFERNVWVGAAGGETKAQVAARARALNSAYVALVADRIIVDAPDGTTPTLEPPYLALMLACMQAGSPIAEPLTHKRPRIRSTSQTWRPNLDAEELLASGVVFLTTDRLGWRVERSITTYLTDDNRILSEVSAWESAQTSIRDVRNVLLMRVGAQGTDGLGERLRGFAAQRLDEQVNFRWIRAWRNLTLDLVGDQFRVSYELAPTEPVNFFLVTATAASL